MLRRCALLMAVLFCSGFCALSASAEPVKITLLHTNDFHANFDREADFLSTIDTLRREYPDALLLDAGDMFDRRTLLTVRTKGEVVVKLMQRAGYDAMTFGDNEFKGFSLEIVRGWMQTLGFPVISVNLVDRSNGDPITLPYWIFHRNGASIGVIGAYDEEPLNDWGVRILNPDPILDFYINHLRTKVDCLVLLTHAGLERDTKWAEQFPQVNVIVGGSSHDALYEPVQINNTLVVQAGSHGRYIGALELYLDREAKAIVDYRGRLIPTGSRP